MHKSCILKLNDSIKNRAKLTVLSKLEIMADDIENDAQKFFIELDDEIQWGKSYKITIEECYD